MSEPARPMIRRRAFLAAAGGLVAACSGGTATRSPAETTRSAAGSTPSLGLTPSRPARRAVQQRIRPAPAPVMLSRSHIPVLCFHQVRDWRVEDSATARAIITPPPQFAAQMQALARAGYTTITPMQLLAWLQYGTGLPARPVMLSFDDASEGQYTNALPVLVAHRFTATFFVMTVVLDKPGWLRRTQVADLHRRGMTIAAHTWDHQPVTGYSGRDWQIQLVQPAGERAAITGAPIRLFAYPYGLCNPAAFPHLQAAGYQAAFQLSQPQDPGHPLLTIRRMMTPSSWDGPTLLRHLHR